MAVASSTGTADIGTLTAGEGSQSQYPDRTRSPLGQAEQATTGSCSVDRPQRRRWGQRTSNLVGNAVNGDGAPRREGDKWNILDLHRQSAPGATEIATDEDVSLPHHQRGRLRFTLRRRGGPEAVEAEATRRQLPTTSLPAAASTTGPHLSMQYHHRR